MRRTVFSRDRFFRLILILVFGALTLSYSNCAGPVAPEASLESVEEPQELFDSADSEPVEASLAGLQEPEEPPIASESEESDSEGLSMQADDPATAQMLASRVTPQDPRLQKQAVLEKEWSKIRKTYAAYARGAVGNSQRIYDVQMVLSGFVQEAYDRRKADWMRDLMAIYLEPARGLKTVSSLVFVTPAEGGQVTVGQKAFPTSRRMKVWLGKDGVESQIASAQFLYPVTMLLMWIAENNLYGRDRLARKFFDTYYSVALRDHLQRWVFNRGIPLGSFQVNGWGCQIGNFSHAQRIEMLAKKAFGNARSYCNVMTDVDLFVLADAMHLMMIYQLKKGSREMSMTAVEYSAFYHYVRSGLSVFATKLSRGTVRDASGRAQEKIVIEMGRFGDYKDFAYSGDLNPRFPGVARAGGQPVRTARPATVLSWWDVSHARRLVNFLWTLGRTNPRLRLGTPGIAERWAAGFTRQIVHHVFNGNLKAPRFSNYLDGTNGWYRVNYAGRTNFGYAPSSVVLGRALINGGYGPWAAFDPAFGEIYYHAVLKSGFNRRNPFECLQILTGMPARYFPALLKGPRTADGSICAF